MSLYSLETVSGHFDTEAVTSIWVTVIFACDFFFFLSDTFRFQAIPGESWQPLHSISGHSCPIRVPLPFDLPRYDLSSSICLLMVSKCAVFNVSRRA